MTPTSEAATLFVNGDPQPFPESALLVDVLRAQGIDPETARGVAVALNETVVRRAAWAETSVQVGDQIELITATQGG